MTQHLCQAITHYQPFLPSCWALSWGGLWQYAAGQFKESSFSRMLESERDGSCCISSWEIVIIMEILHIMDVALDDRYQKGCFALLYCHCHLVLVITFKNRREFQLRLLDLQCVLFLWWKGNCSVIIYEYPVLTLPHEQNSSIQKENERKKYGSR